MSKITGLTIIRDPIHNYIPISQLEENLIGDPLFLRLRYVTQNGLAHLVYPSNRTSRFSHSLGAMHIGGKMLIAGLANAAKEDLDKFWGSLNRVLEEEMGKVITNSNKIETYLRDSNDSFYRESGFNPTDCMDMKKIVVLQSLRIACVMHDLGHFPFSHTVEEVLFDLYRSLKNRPSLAADESEFVTIIDSVLSQSPRPIKAEKLHEAIGRNLTSHIFRSFPEDGSRSFAVLCFSIAEKIVSANDPVLKCLSSIVSGNLDSDRCDYVRRDGHACGFEFGDFDLQRILATIRFRTTGQDTLGLLATTIATSALESFFLERYRIFKWLVFHPMVVRVNLALARALTILLEIRLGEKVSLSEKVNRALHEMQLERLWKPLRNSTSYKDFIECDEAWLLTLLRRVQSELRQLPDRLPLKLLALRVYLDLICDRKKDYLHPLWKRQEDYHKFCKKVIAELRSRENRPTKLKLEGDPVVVFNNVLEIMVRDSISEGKITIMRQLERRIQDSLNARRPEIGIIADILSFRPYDKTQVLDTRFNEPLALEELSTIVANLDNMWTKEMRFRPFCWSRKEVDGFYQLAETSGAPADEEFAKAVVEAIPWANVDIIKGGDDDILP